MLMQMTRAIVGGFAPVTNTYTGTSGTETVPAGATTCVIEEWGGGGGATSGSPSPGSGGGGGGYSTRTVAVTGGQTFTYSAPTGVSGTGGTASIVSAAPVVSMSCNGGVSGAGGGAGGTASGGTTNTTGGNGSAPTGGSSPNGGAAQPTPGATGNTPGGGGAGSVTPATAGQGAPGRCRFSYT